MSSSAESETHLSILKNELEKIDASLVALEVAQSYHGCDSYDDIFDKEFHRLIELKHAVEIAIDTIESRNITA
jgi:translation initiation factor 2 beta subunit (eIF-2beta)/eIF-5